MTDWSGLEQYEADLRSYFVSCPVCGSAELTAKLIPGGRDKISCNDCKATWHVHIGLTGFKWAELDVPASDGQGTELLGKRFGQKDILKLAQDKRKMPSKRIDKDLEINQTIKEVIKEKEVIVKIRCSYCHHLFNELENKCPHCGGRA
jgi:hypothetical protein